MTTWDTTRNASAHLAFSNANQAVTYTGTSGTDSPAFGLIFNSSGKWICRFNVVQGDSVGGGTQVGFGDSTASSAGGQYLGIDTNSVGLSIGGNWSVNNAFTASGIGTFATGDLVDIAIDLGGKLTWVRKNGGGWFGNNGSGDPVAGTNGFDISGLAGFTLSPACDLIGGTTNDSIDIGTQTTTVSGYTSWDPIMSAMVL
jgi:hypothetical protein